MTTNADPPTDAGFTLMELLVAMTLLAIMASLLLGGIQFGTRVWEEATHQSTSADQERAVRRLLKRLLAQSYPYFHDTTQSDSVPAFVGERNEIIFSSEAPRQFPVQGLHRFRLVHGQSRGGDGPLEIQWTVDRNGKKDPRYDETAQSKELLQNVEVFEITYFDGEDWGSRWTANNSLPDLIRIDLTMKGADQGWIPLVVHPAIDMDSRCQYDPVSRRCRPR